MLELHNITAPQFSTKVEDLNTEKFKKVLVIGLGQIGLPVAKYIHKKGFETYGFDVNLEAVKLAKNME